MDENEKTPPQKPESDKKLKLDLSEALNQGFDEDDDIIELKDEVTPPPKAKIAEIDRDDQVNANKQADEPVTETISGLDVDGEEADVAKSVDHLADDLVFEEDDEDKENSDFPDDKLSFEEEDEDLGQVLPLVDEDGPLKADADNEVVEITEFDDILSEDSNEMMTLSDVGKESKPEEEFLELIDVEEDSLAEEDGLPEIDDEIVREDIEDDIIQFDGPGAGEDSELEDFINDSLGEEIRIDDNFEDDLTNALEVEDESDINLTASPSGTEEFDFEMDSSEISKKIDGLETIFFDEPDAGDKFDEDTEPEAEAIGSTVSESGDKTDEISEKIDRLENTFFDESEDEDEFDEDAVSESGLIAPAASESDDKTDEISEKIDRLENTFFDESEDEDEFDEDAVSGAGLVAPAASEAGDKTDEISEKIDRLENTFFDEPEGLKELDEDAEPGPGAFGATVSVAGDEAEEEDIETTDAEPSGEPPADGSLDALTGASREQIEKSIERIILNNFSDKIESIVTETIEKAVSKEIARLKNILLEDGSDENF